MRGIDGAQIEAEELFYLADVGHGEILGGIWLVSPGVGARVSGRDESIIEWLRDRLELTEVERRQVVGLGGGCRPTPNQSVHNFTCAARQMGVHLCRGCLGNIF